MSSLVDKSLNSENGVFLFVKTYEAVSLGISRSTIERFFKQLQDLQILIKVAEKEIQEESSTKEFSAYAINADNLEIFLEADLKLNKYYKSIFGETKKKEKSDNSKIIALVDEVKIRDEKIKELEKLIEESKTIQNVTDSQEYKDLAESNRLLESTASRLADENEELKKKLESNALENSNIGTEVEKDELIQVLESKLKKAREIFKEQQSIIISLRKAQEA
uniref:TBPIP domain-containing protein n=1 Tax=Syphacia muris TaxID=451379 RepID=A0A0N5ACN8_9BILA